ncbi:MAG: zinc-binding dehydrogenase [Promethearchaeota archaeon]
MKVIGVTTFVIEPIEYKHKLATELGAELAFIPQNSKKIQRLTKKIGPNQIFDCVGITETLNSALNLIRKGG